MQPYLLELYGDPEAYGIAGLAAAIVAGAQIAGGMRRPDQALFACRTTALMAAIAASALHARADRLFDSFWVVIALIVVWGLLFVGLDPIRQAYLNGLIASEERATVLSFDSMLGSTGGVVAQPVLGRAADVWGYPASYLRAPGSRRSRCLSSTSRIASTSRPTTWSARRLPSSPRKSRRKRENGTSRAGTSPAPLVVSPTG